MSGNELKIIKASVDDGGTYVCSGQNKLGTQSQRSVISVESIKDFFFNLLFSTFYSSHL